MNSAKNTAKTVGALFIIATLVASISQIILDPILNAGNLLDNASENSNLLVFGAFLELIDAFAVAAIAITMFSVFKKHNQDIAVGYVSIRVTEAVLMMIASVSIVSVYGLSKNRVYSDNSNDTVFENLSSFLLIAHDWTYLMMLIAFSSGALMFYFLLYQSRLVPRFLSVWGFFSAILALAACLLQLFGIVTVESTFSTILFFSIALNEIVLAVWLIVKGFEPAAIISEPIETNKKLIKD